jgi:hypothetical protein
LIRHTFPCPHCGRTLDRCGEAHDPDLGRCDTFQCDHCLVEVMMFGRPREAALTFAVTEDGRAFDPATPDGSLPPLKPGG